MLQVFGDGLFRHAVAVVEQPQLHALAVLLANAVGAWFPAGLVQDPGGLGHVIFVGFQIDVAIGDTAGIQRIRGKLGIVEHPLGDGDTVGGMLQGLADMDVGKYGILAVEDDMPGGGGGGKGNAKVLAVPVFVQGIGIQHVLAPDQVDLAFFQSQDARLVVGDDLDHHTLDLGLFAPVGLIGLEHGVFVRNDLGQLVGPGAHIGRHAILGGAVLHGFGRDDGKGTGHAQFREHGPVRGFHEDAEGMGIRGIHLFQQMHHLQPGMAGTVFQDGIEVGLDGKSIARGPVSERDALADMEGVDFAVGRNIPAFGQAGLVTVGRDVHQGLEDHFLGIHLTGIQVGIEITDIPVVDKIQRIGRVIRGPGVKAGKKECPCQGKREGQLAECGMNGHAVRPLLWNKNSFSFPMDSMP